MTALVVPPEQILAEVARTYHDDRVGTLDGFNWHRATRSDPCLACRDAHNEDVNSRRRHPEYQRLLDAGVNRDTARYLARVTRSRQTRRTRLAAEAA